MNENIPWQSLQKRMMGKNRRSHGLFSILLRTWCKTQGKNYSFLMAMCKSVWLLITTLLRQLIDALVFWFWLTTQIGSWKEKRLTKYSLEIIYCLSQRYMEDSRCYEECIVKKGSIFSSSRQKPKVQCCGNEWTGKNVNNHGRFNNVYTTSSTCCWVSLSGSCGVLNPLWGVDKPVTGLPRPTFGVV